MFRISKTDQNTVVKLTIDGELIKNHVAIAQQCCEDLLDAGRTIEVVHRDVGVIDDDGRSWLGELLGRGVRVVGRNLYVSYVVDGLKRSASR